MHSSNNIIIIVSCSVIFLTSSQIFFIAWSRNCLLQLFEYGSTMKTRSMKARDWRKNSLVSSVFFKVTYFWVCSVFFLKWDIICKVVSNYTILWTCITVSASFYKQKLEPCFVGIVQSDRWCLIQVHCALAI